MKRSFRKNEEIRSKQSKYPSANVKALGETLNGILTRKMRICFNSIKIARASAENKQSKFKRVKRLELSNKSLGAKRQNSLSITDDDFQLTKEEMTAQRNQCEEVKRMRLGQQFREALMSVQKFDRTTYNSEGEKLLKMPIVAQLRRLQRAKNQYQQMRGKTYDNELTVTVIGNYLKLVSQMNKEMEKMGSLKAKTTDLQKKVSDMTLQHRKEIGQYKKKVMFMDLGNSRSRRSGSSSVIAPDDSFSERSSNLQKDNQELRQARASEINKYQENQAKMQSKIADLMKELSSKQQKERRVVDLTDTIQQFKRENARLTQENEGLRSQLSEMQQLKSLQLTPRALLFSSKSSNVDRDKQRLRQLDDFLSFYTDTKEKSAKQQGLNQLKAAYPDSPLLQLLESQIWLKTRHDTILSSLKQVISLFSENAWRRRSRILMQQSGEIFDCINQIISLLLTLCKQKEQTSSALNEMDSWRKKCKTLSEQNTEIKLSLKQFQTQLSKKTSSPQRKRETQSGNGQGEEEKTNSTINHLYGQVQKLKEQLLQAKIDSDSSVCQQRLASYKMLYQKIRHERDNLKLLLEEKNEQYEISKQNEEKYEELKVKDQQIINELNGKLAKTGLQQQSAMQQLARNKQEVEKLQQHIIQLQIKYESAIKQKENTQSYFSLALKDQENKAKLQLKQVCQLRSHLQRSKEDNSNLQSTISKLQSIMQQKGSEQSAKYAKLLKQLEQTKQDFELERQIFRQKLAQFHEYSLISSSNIQFQKKSKQQLRQQLQRTSCELAACIRNSENQKRQTRKYIQQLLQDGQKRCTLHNQQKRLLVADVQRARTQQYQINQGKIKQLRETLHTFRTENDRLAHIIDSNEAPFNQLVIQHQALSEEILVLQESNKELSASISTLLMEKQSYQQSIQSLQNENSKLISHMHSLEQNIIDDQRKNNQIVRSMHQKEDYNRNLRAQATNLQSIIQKMSAQNSTLQARMSQKHLQMGSFETIVSRLQSEMTFRQDSSNQSYKALQDKHNQYTKYLQTKLADYELSQKEFRQKEIQLLNKIQRQMKIARQISEEKESLLRIIGQKNLQLNMERQNRQRQIATQADRYAKLKSVIDQKTVQIDNLRRNSVDNQIVNKLAETLKVKEDEVNFLRTDISHLKHILQQNSKHLQGFLQQNKRIALQNKRFLNKIALIESELTQSQQKYRQSLQKIFTLESQAKQRNQQKLQSLKRPCQSTQKDLSSSDELIFARQQIKIKEDQVAQLRHLNFTIQKKYSDLQRRVAQLELKEQKHLQDFKYSEEIKAKLKNAQDQLIGLQKQKKSLEDNHAKARWQWTQELAMLQDRIHELIRQNKGLNAHIVDSKASQRQLLLQIVKDLDENYKLDAEDSHIKTLHKISRQITQLVDINHALREKCQLSTQNQQMEIEQMERTLSLSLRNAIDDCLVFLADRNIIKPDQVSFLSRETEISALIDELGPFLKRLFTISLNNSQLQIAKYNNIIRDITILIEEAQSSKNFQNLNKLVFLLRQAE